MAKKEKQKKSRAERMAEQAIKLRTELWPDVDEDQLWHRKRSDGFITVPRTMPWLFGIMDDLSSGKPVSSTYFALWCRSFDHSTVTIQSPRELAAESGFGGERAEGTWLVRMRALEELGFIRSAEGASGPFHHVLLMNPYHVVRKLKSDGKVSTLRWNGLFTRAQQVGAKDLEIND